jgi:predicted metal-dependent HD superfamily phosphohydrolase
MDETQEQILAEGRHYVTETFTHKVNPEFVFHSLDHTEAVAEACSQMADYYQLSNEDRFVLMLSAWFHDTGYSAGKTEGHEEISAQIATQFLQQHKISDIIQQRVSSCIRATHMPQSPISQVEKILCDADLAHLASPDYKAMSQLLRQERESLLGHKISKKEWRKGNIKFLLEHTYFTDYGQQILEPKKQENLSSLSKKKDEKNEVEKADQAFPYVSVVDTRNEKSIQKSAERGIQTMFRITSSNHLRLSSMSDNKAHIMISVNSIIISIVISVLFGKFSVSTSSREFIFPACILLMICLASMTFSILATRPSVSGGKFTEEDIRNKKTNLLFFGNFYRMELEDYQRAMNQMMKDGEYLYDSMIKDVYYLGIVLAKKYKYLRISYTIFMWGLIVAVLAFAVTAFIVAGHSTTTAVPTIDY